MTWIYTNSPKTSDNLTPGKIYRAEHHSNVMYLIIDDEGGEINPLIGRECAWLEGDQWSVLSDYHAKHLEG